MLKFLKFSAALTGAATAAVLSVSAANAALVSTTPACTNGNALTAMAPSAIACLGAFTGNDANQQADILAALASGFTAQTGAGAWAYGEKVDAGGTGSILLTVPGSAAGTIQFANAVSDFFALSLKASNQFSLYLFDGRTTPIASISFTTIGSGVNNKGKPQDLSHATYWDFTASGGNSGDAGPSDVPVPLGIALLASGIAMLGLKRRRN